MHGVMGRPSGSGRSQLLNNDSGKWQVTQAKRKREEPIYDAAAKKSLAAEDSKLVDILKAVTMPREFVSKPIGKSADNMYSYLALVQDDPTVRVVNNAQKRMWNTLFRGDPDLAETAGAVRRRAV